MNNLVVQTWWPPSFCFRHCKDILSKALKSNKKAQKKRPFGVAKGRLIKCNKLIFSLLNLGR